MKRILGVTAVAVLLIGALIAPATAHDDVDNTCKDLAGFDENLEGNSQGAWGSITFSDKEATLTLEVNEGWEVTLCVKAGSANQDDGPEVKGPFGEGSHSISHSTGKELSHYDYVARELPDEPEPDQVWVCRGGEVFGPINEGTSNDGETEYDSAEEAAQDPNCVDDEEPEQVWVCRDGQVSQVGEDELEDGETAYDSESEAAEDEDCVDDREPDQVWVCRDGQVSQVGEDELLDDETAYDSEAEAAEDEDCADDGEEQEPEIELAVSGNSACVGLEDEDEPFLGLFVNVDTNSDEEVSLTVDGEEIDLAGDGGILLRWPTEEGEPVESVELEASVEDVTDSAVVELDDDEVERCTAVLPGQPIERPEPKPTDGEPKPVDRIKVEVKGEVLEVSKTLPKTGGSTLLLALLGLTALGSGGAILRRNR